MSPRIHDSHESRRLHKQNEYVEELHRVYKWLNNFNNQSENNKKMSKPVSKEWEWFSDKLQNI